MNRAHLSSAFTDPIHHSSLTYRHSSTNDVSLPFLTAYQLNNRSKPIIAVVFYSTYGHIEKLAEAIIKGVESTGAEVRPYILLVPFNLPLSFPSLF